MVLSYFFLDSDNGFRYIPYHVILHFGKAVSTEYLYLIFLLHSFCSTYCAVGGRNSSPRIANCRDGISVRLNDTLKCMESEVQCEPRSVAVAVVIRSVVLKYLAKLSHCLLTLIARWLVVATCFGSFSYGFRTFVS